MLTKETLIANEALAGLTEDQITAITTLSENDENTVIGQKFGEVYRQMDSTIEKATGIKRDGDEKTYLYLERATKAFADKYADYDTVKNRVLGCLMPVVFNAVIVGAVLTWGYQIQEFENPLLSYGFNALTVGIGEAGVLYLIGYTLLRQLPKLKFFREMMEKCK